MSEAKDWLVRIDKGVDTDTAMVLLGHAGSTPTDFYGWDQYMDTKLALYALLLPGRNERYGESINGDIYTLAAEVYRILSELNYTQIVLLGVSFGGVLSYEIAKLDYINNTNIIGSVIVVACSPLMLSHFTAIHSQHNRAALLDLLIEKSYLENTALNHPRLIDLIFPRIMEDILCRESWIPDLSVKISCPVYPVAFDNDKLVSCDLVHSWLSCSENTISQTYVCRGEHLGYLARSEEFKNVIEKICKSY